MSAYTIHTYSWGSVLPKELSNIKLQNVGYNMIAITSCNTESNLK